MAEGAVYPRWVPEFYYGYGYPLFNYYAPLSYYVGLPLAVEFGKQRPVVGFDELRLAFDSDFEIKPKDYELNVSFTEAMAALNSTFTDARSCTGPYR